MHGVDHFLIEIVEDQSQNASTCTLRRWSPNIILIRRRGVHGRGVGGFSRILVARSFQNFTDTGWPLWVVVRTGRKRGPNRHIFDQRVIGKRPPTKVPEITSVVRVVGATVGSAVQWTKHSFIAVCKCVLQIPKQTAPVAAGVACNNSNIVAQ